MTEAGSMWRRPPKNIRSRIEVCLDTALEKSKGPVELFFRADDAGVPGKRFERLVSLFARNRMPLDLAVVPAWLTGPRWHALLKIGGAAGDLLCWHQHGWRHVNHEPAGKKQEFGSSRPKDVIQTDLVQGRDRLLRMMGGAFCPVFTPPWNRCGKDTLEMLPAAGYKAVSRTCGSLPPVTEGLLELPVGVDLHTLKEKTPARAWHRLFSDLHRAIAAGRCGIMIHHRVMNDAAFGFLEDLLTALANRNAFCPVNFGDLI